MAFDRPMDFWCGSLLPALHRGWMRNARTAQKLKGAGKYEGRKPIPGSSLRLLQLEIARGISEFA
jgi:hypothetical protein